MMSWVAEVLARARAKYRGVIHRDRVESEMREEFEHHIAERAAHLVRDGMNPKDAEYRARREFGHQTTLREQSIEPLALNSFAQLRFSWLDFKLALRGLPKHPLLNLAAIFALAVGIPIGLAPSHFARALESPLPGDPSNQLRAVRQWDPASSDVAATWDNDFTWWKESLHSFSSLGAFRISSYNLVSPDGRAAPASGAQLSSAIFQMLGARPLHGRLFSEGDYASDASDVVVISRSLWSSRFGEDPNVLGRPIRIGSKMHVVVGVMPEGFAFPSNETLWLPLRLTLGNRVRVHVMGRLADGVTPAAAQAELSSLRPAPSPVAQTVEEREERARLRPEVVAVPLLFLNLPAGGVASLPEYRVVQALMMVLLLVACGNVTMLVFARTATRLQELAIRTAIGASRIRIVSQIFVETLLLAAIAAGVGLVLFDWGLTHVNLAALAGQTSLPYWLQLGLTSGTAREALVLAVLSATLAGVIPAVVITGKGVARNIRGGARVRFGKVTGALVVADIAVSVAAVALAFATAVHATDLDATNRATGVVASEYLAAEVRLPGNTAASDAHSSALSPDRLKLAVAQRSLVAALEREPGVQSVAVAEALPRMEHRSTLYELEHVELVTGEATRSTRLVRVDADYFRALGTPLIAGRDFTQRDIDGSIRTAIVNTAFVTRALRGRDPIGQRIRLSSRASVGDSTWYEIVGVIGPLGVNLLNPDRGSAVYLPAALGTINPMQIAVHAVLPPNKLASRVRELALTVDPDLVVGRASALSDLRPGDWYLVIGLAVGLFVLVGVLIALVTSGLYAMMSLSVTERTREIGIRAALGAPRRTLLLTLLRRSLLQIAVGAALGLPVAARSMFELANSRAGNGSFAFSLAMSLLLTTGLVVLVVLTSCVAPARRILAVQASEAMRAGG